MSSFIYVTLIRPEIIVISGCQNTITIKVAAWNLGFLLAKVEFENTHIRQLDTLYVLRVVQVCTDTVWDKSKLCIRLTISRFKRVQIEQLYPLYILSATDIAAALSPVAPATRPAPGNPIIVSAWRRRSGGLQAFRRFLNSEAPDVAGCCAGAILFINAPLVGGVFRQRPRAVTLGRLVALEAGWV